jgi:hypothetical protein
MTTKKEQEKLTSKSRISSPGKAQAQGKSLTKTQGDGILHLQQNRAHQEWQRE